MTRGSTGESSDPALGDRAESPGAPASGAFDGVAKHTLIYGLGMLIGRGVSFLMLPIYTRFLSPADYGVMGLVEMTLDFVAIIGAAKLALGIFRFYHKSNSESERQQVVATSFALIGIMYVVVGALAFAAALPLSSLVFGSAEHALLFRVAAVNLAVSSLVIVPLSLARVQDRSLFFVGANLAKLSLLVVFNLLFLVWMGLGVFGVFLSSLAANVIVGGALTVWLFRRISFAMDIGAAKALFRYGLPLMGMQVATFVATFGDRFFLQGYGDETTVGLYNLAYQFAFLMLMVGFVPVDQIWGPRRFIVAQQPEGHHVLARAFVYIHILVVTTGFGIAVLVGDVLRVMTTPAFFHAADVVPLLLLAYVFKSWSSVLDLGILLSERTEFLTIANVMAAGVAVLGFWLLVPPFLGWGAACATIAAFACRFGLTYIFAQRLNPIPYEWSPVLVSLAWAGLLVAFRRVLFGEMNLAASTAVNLGTIGLYFVGLWWLPILKGEARLRAADFGVKVKRYLLRESPASSA